MVSLHMRKIHTEVDQISRGINLECSSWLKTPEARVTSLHTSTLKYWSAGDFGTWLRDIAHYDYVCQNSFDFLIW